MSKHRNEVALFDVDDTLVHLGPKAVGIQQLEKALLAGALQLRVAGIVPAEMKDSEIEERWRAYRSQVLADPACYSRFFSSAEEAAAASKEMQGYVLYEAIKRDDKAFAKVMGTLMVAGIALGNIPIIPYDDAVVAVSVMAEQFRIGTYSGGADKIQRLQLAQVPVSLKIEGRTATTSIADIVDDPNVGAGFFDKKSGGRKKTDPKSYVNIMDALEKKGLTFDTYFADGQGEVEASKEAGVNSVYVERRPTGDATLERLDKQGIVIIRTPEEFNEYALAMVDSAIVS